MCHQIPYRLISNMGNILRKSRIQGYHYNLFATNTSYRALSIFTRNSKNDRHYFFNCETTDDVYKNFLKEDSPLSELSNIPCNKEVYYNCLYPEIHAENDPVLELIVNASTIEELFDLIKGHPNNEKYASQAIVTLLVLKNAYCNLRSDTTSTNSVDNKDFIQVFSVHFTKLFS